MRVRIDRETKCYVHVSFRGRFRTEEIKIDNVRLLKGSYFGASWSQKSKTLILKPHGKSWTNSVRIHKKNLGCVVSAVMLHNGKDGYLWVTPGIYLPEPMGFFGIPLLERETPFGGQ